MSGIPSLTILSEEQKFNGDNLLQWNTNITQLLGSKELLGYISGDISKPGPESIPLPTSETTITILSTPIYSGTPTFDEWNFRDQLARGHITLNCTNVASLGVITTGTAKDAWDSIQMEWGRSTDMRWSYAQEALNQMIYAKGTEIQDHTHKAALDNLSNSVMSNETWRGVIIWSIPPTLKWLPVIPSLYSMASSADIISMLCAHGMIIGRDVKGTTNSLNMALAAWTTESCTNPNCEAKKQSMHILVNCYWLRGGKEGQFPPNFGQRNQANITASMNTPTPSQPTSTPTHSQPEHSSSQHRSQIPLVNPEYWLDLRVTICLWHVSVKGARSSRKGRYLLSWTLGQVTWCLSWGTHLQSINQLHLK